MSPQATELCAGSTASWAAIWPPAVAARTASTAAHGRGRRAIRGACTRYPAIAGNNQPANFGDDDELEAGGARMLPEEILGRSALSVTQTQIPQR